MFNLLIQHTMKNMRFFFWALALTLFSVSLSARDEIISEQQLPAAAKTFGNQYFTHRTVSLAKKDVDFGSTTYDVVLNSGTKIEFNAKGEWKEVDCAPAAVPAALIPAAIAKYVKANYANLKIVKIERDRSGFDIELSNDVDLRFDKQGKFIRVDD